MVSNSILRSHKDTVRTCLIRRYHEAVALVRKTCAYRIITILIYRVGKDIQRIMHQTIAACPCVKAYIKNTSLSKASSCKAPWKLSRRYRVPIRHLIDWIHPHHRPKNLKIRHPCIRICPIDMSLITIDTNWQKIILIPYTTSFKSPVAKPQNRIHRSCSPHAQLNRIQKAHIYNHAAVHHYFIHPKFLSIRRSESHTHRIPITLMRADTVCVSHKAFTRR